VPKLPAAIEEQLTRTLSGLEAGVMHAGAGGLGLVELALTVPCPKAPRVSASESEVCAEAAAGTAPTSKSTAQTAKRHRLSIQRSAFGTPLRMATPDRDELHHTGAANRTDSERQSRASSFEDGGGDVATGLSGQAHVPQRSR
jgi:hypothetical protein